MIQLQLTEMPPSNRIKQSAQYIVVVLNKDKTSNKQTNNILTNLRSIKILYIQLYWIYYIHCNTVFNIALMFLIGMKGVGKPESKSSKLKRSIFWVWGELMKKINLQNAVSRSKIGSCYCFIYWNERCQKMIELVYFIHLFRFPCFSRFAKSYSSTSSSDNNIPTEVISTQQRELIIAYPNEVIVIVPSEIGRSWTWQLIIEEPREVIIIEPSGMILTEPREVIIIVANEIDKD